MTQLQLTRMAAIATAATAWARNHGTRLALCVLMLALSIGLGACGTNVGQKVAYDFGLGPKPEGYVAPSERVMERLDAVGKAEMKRMNNEQRHGEVKYQDLGNLKGKYYKESKLYTGYQPLEVRALSRGSQEQRGYIGYISYTYHVMQSERKTTRAEAAAATAKVRTGESGTETFRYTFNAGGYWDGSEGDRVKR